MKTNQVLQRKMGTFEVLQRTSDGYFDANLLLSQWNNSKLRTGRRKMVEFTDSPKTKEFIDTILKRESHGRKNDNVDLQSVKQVKGRMTKKGRTKDQVWMHPFLFLDFAMWINAEFKYDVIKFVYDQLIQYRNEAGDAYKEMAEAIVSIIPKAEDSIKSIKYVAHAVNIVVWGKHERDIRNKQAEEAKMKDLCELERDVSMLIKKKFIRNINQLRDYLLQEYRDRHEPKLLTA